LTSHGVNAIYPHGISSRITATPEEARSLAEKRIAETRAERADSRD